MNRFSINTQFIGQQQLYYPACPSTNAEALRLVNKNKPEEGTVIITDHQTAGRGQRDNHWESEAGLNLTFSVIIYPELPVMHQFYLNMIASLAVADTLALAYQHVKVKWPNDILFTDKKLCGILIQNNLRINKIQSSVMGIGINVNQTGFSYSKATSLALISGKTVRREEILSGLLENLEKRYLQLKNGNFLTLKTNYLQKLYWLYEERWFADEAGEFTGEIVGMDESGQLMIRTARELRKYGIKEVKYLGC